MSAIAPITGTLKRKIISDIAIGLSIGGAMAYFWWGFRCKRVRKREEYYAKLAQQKAAEQ